VMRNGETVEETTAEALRRDQAASDYTRALIRASQGFSRPERQAIPPLAS
jgi:hypothetical protein